MTTKPHRVKSTPLPDPDLPPRVQAAERRSEFRAWLEASSLGEPDVQAAVEHLRRYIQALPDRWMRVADLPHLLGMYRDRRDTWGESHAVVAAYVLSEADYEPSQDDVDRGKS